MSDTKVWRRVIRIASKNIDYYIKNGNTKCARVVLTNIKDDLDEDRRAAYEMKLQLLEEE